MAAPLCHRNDDRWHGLRRLAPAIRGRGGLAAGVCLMAAIAGSASQAVLAQGAVSPPNQGDGRARSAPSVASVAANLEATLREAARAMNEKNHAAALALYRQAAADGDAQSWLEIGKLQQAGRGTERSDEQALLSYKKAADLSVMQAMARLGLLRLQLLAAAQAESGAKPAAATQAPSKPAALVRKSTASNALPALGGTPLPDRDKALALVVEAAEGGDAFGQYAMGYLHQHGLARPVDMGVAADWYARSTAQGEPNAQSALGLMYLEGRGVPEHAATAYTHLFEAARQGEPVSQLRLGLMFRDGWGVDRDDQESAFWMERAAEQGDAGAMAELAMLLMQSDELRARAAAALDWLSKAALSGHLDAQFQLGRLLIERSPAGRDPAEGLEWMRRAGEAGMREAVSYLYDMQQRKTQQ